MGKCEGPNSGHNEHHVFAKIFRPDQRLPAPVQHKPRRRKGFGGPRRRVCQLEKDVELLKQQVQDLIAQKQKQPEIEQPIYEPEVVEPVDIEEPSVIIEDVIEDDIEDIVDEVQVIEPEIPEATQQMLEMLHQMGFTDDSANIAALSANDNNIEAALNSLLM